MSLFRGYGKGELHSSIPASILHKQYEVEKADNNPEKALFYLEQYDSIKDSIQNGKLLSIYQCLHLFDSLCVII